MIERRGELARPKPKGQASLPLLKGFLRASPCRVERRFFMMTNTDLYRGAPNDNRSLRRGELARPTRKNSLRLKDYDYSLSGPYFFTVCLFNRKEIFKEQNIRGKVIEVFKNLAGELGIDIHAIVIASNHLHGVVTLPDDRRVTLWQYIGTAKVRITQMIIGQASLPLRDRIWQRSFYDHIIRDENDFSQKAQYIENHPIKEEGDIYAEWH